MASNKGYTVSGYGFANENDAKLAHEEEKKINYIRSKLNYNDPKSVKVIYDKMIKNRLFVTLIGMNFLKEVHDNLVNSGAFEPDEISSVPLYISYSSTPSMEDEQMPASRIRRQQKPSIKTYRSEYNICRIIILVLLLCVCAMFYITLNSENPNILNYETNLKNKYSAWEQELNEREAELRDKEREITQRGGI